jgi:DNA-binding NtrC family response regulator
MMETGQRPTYRILVVDDDAPILFALSEYFSMDGHTIDCAEDKKSAETLLNEKNYSIVITDLRLNGLFGNEGLEIAETARRVFPETKIILMTSYSSKEIEEEAVKAGVDIFLQKPIQLSKLSEILSKLLKVCV